MKPFPNIYANLRRRIAAQNGFTLIEMLVTILILSIIVIALSNFFIASVNQTEQERMADAQHAAWIQSSGWLTQHLLSASSIGLASATDSSELDPLTVAGDQLIFQAAGNCYRVYYQESSSTVSAAEAASCSTIRPTRGPNESGSGTSTTDPVLDSGGCSPTTTPSCQIFVLADNVVTTTSSPLQVFKYYTSDDTLLDVDTHADGNVSASHSSFYTSATTEAEVAAEISSIQLNENISYNASDTAIPVADESVQISPGQSFTGADPTVYGRVDGDNTGAWTTIASGAAYADVQTNSSGNLLQTPAVTSQSGWLSYDGALQVRSGSSSLASGGVPVIEAVLYRDGYAASSSCASSPPPGCWVSDLEPQTSFVYASGTALSGNTPQTITFSGQFKLPADSLDSSSDTYSVHMLIENTDTSNSFDYSSDPAGMWLDYHVVLR